MPFENQTDGSFSITVQLGDDDREVTLVGSDFTNIAANGYSFSLPAGSTVEMGSIDDAIDWINARLPQGVPQIPRIQTNADNWPEPIKSMAQAVGGTTVIVEKFEVQQDPKPANESNYPPLRLDVVIAAVVPDANKELIPGLLSVERFGVGLVRSYTRT